MATPQTNPLEVLMVGRDQGLESALLSGAYSLRSTSVADLDDFLDKGAPDIIVVGPDVNVSDCINLISSIRKGDLKALPILYIRTLGSLERSRLFEIGLDGCVDETSHRSELLRRIGLHDDLFRLRRRIDEFEESAKSHQAEIDRLSNLLLAANQEVVRVSSVDALTGLANARRLYEILEQEWKRAQRSSSSLALVLADLDRFKGFNERYGHRQGDECLRTVGREFASCLNRGGDFISRFGGEEFALLLPSSNEEQALALVEKLRATLSDLDIDHEDSPSGKLSASFGIATVIPREEISPASLIASAEEALKEAKKAGRDQTHANKLR